MRINNLWYLMKEGIKGIFLHGFMSFAAVCVTVACLLIVGSFSALVYNLNLMITDLNKTNEVMVYVDDTLSDAEARSVGTKLNRVENIANAEFISRDQALKDFIADHPETDAFAGTSAETFRHRFRVTLKNNRFLEDTKADIEAVPGVVKVRAAEEMAAGFVMMQEVVELVSLVVIAALLVVSLIIISNTVKLAVYDRRKEISIMKMVGATNGFIRFPFLVQGFFLGILGAGIAFGLEWLMYEALMQRISMLDTIGFFSMVPFTELLVPMVAVFVTSGTLVGILGSWASIAKFMDV